MLDMLSYLGVLEGALLGLLGGLALVSAVGYYQIVSTKSQQVTSEKRLLTTIDYIISFTAIGVLILVIAILLVFGFADGGELVVRTYSVKLSLILIGIGITVSMKLNYLSAHYGIPALIAKSIFLAMYHHYTVHIAESGSIVLAVAIYLSSLALVQIFFILLRKKHGIVVEVWGTEVSR